MILLSSFSWRRQRLHALLLLLDEPPYAFVGVLRGDRGLGGTAGRRAGLLGRELDDRIALVLDVHDLFLALLLERLVLNLDHLLVKVFAGKISPLAAVELGRIYTDSETSLHCAWRIDRMVSFAHFEVFYIDG